MKKSDIYRLALRATVRELAEMTDQGVVCEEEVYEVVQCLCDRIGIAAIVNDENLYIVLLWNGAYTAH